ncbi:hypothetical protein JW823_09065 [bacterium]|nr:hypothetical protein [candidate division CSSED10-310 bacterium]
MRFWLINILGSVLFVFSTAADVQRARVNALAFVLPVSDQGSTFENMSVPEVIKHLNERTGYHFNDGDLEFNSREFLDVLQINGGALINSSINDVTMGEEVEAHFVYPMECKGTDQDGEIRGRYSSFEESPGLHLIVTPRPLEDQSGGFSLDYFFEIALNSGNFSSLPINSQDGCPGLDRYSFRDQIRIDAGQWHIISVFIIENTDRHEFYEVWLLTRLLTTRD